LKFEEEFGELGEFVMITVVSLVHAAVFLIQWINDSTSFKLLPPFPQLQNLFHQALTFSANSSRSSPNPPNIHLTSPANTKISSSPVP
jgi:hypothetical protein